MIKEQTIDLGEYKVVIRHDDSGNGHLVVTILDELDDVIDGIEIYNESDEQQDD